MHKSADWLPSRPPEVWVRLGVAVVLALVLGNCSASEHIARMVDPRHGVSQNPRVVEEGEAVPKGGGVYRIGKPYVMAGRVFTPQPDPNYRSEGLASWYGNEFHGRRTANGEVFDQHAISAAHPTLPLPSYVRVTNVANRRSIVVRVNDRGPFAGNRVIDVSARAADLLGFRHNGLARVVIEYIGPAPLEGNEDHMLLATMRTDGQPAPAPSLVRVASVGPFAPASGRGALIPSPPGRPFEMGEASPAPAAPAAQPAVAEAPPVVSAPVVPAAFRPAPTPFAPVAPSVLSGRGLY